MSTQNNEIFSSTGSRGTAVRQNERLYTNEGYVDDADTLIGRFVEQLEHAALQPRDVSRVVFRALIGEQTRDAVLASEFAADIEVLLPITNGQDLIYIARNLPHRLQDADGSVIDALIRGTTLYAEPSRDMTLPIANAVEHGYEWRTEITEDDVSQVHDLWGETFGWEKDELLALRARLDSESDGVPADKTVWISTARHEDEVVAAAMAERLMLAGRDGPVNIIESTEWRVRNDHQRRNNPAAPQLMRGTLAILNAQVLRDVGGEDTLIMAECNLRSRSDYVGNSAGFRVPPRNFGNHVVRQVIRHNVAVNDGFGGPRDPYPHFVPMQVSQRAIGQSYSPQSIDRLLQRGVKK